MAALTEVQKNERSSVGVGDRRRLRRLNVLLGNGNALTFKAHRLTGDDFAALAGFHHAVNVDQAVGNSDFRLRAAFTQPSSFSRSHSSTCGCLPKEKFAISGLLNVVILFARLQRVLNEGGYGHRADAAGNRRMYDASAAASS